MKRWRGSEIAALYDAPMQIYLNHMEVGEMLKRSAIVMTLIFSLLISMPVMAQEDPEGLTVDVTVSNDCGEAAFNVEIAGGSPPYKLEWVFGDGTTLEEPEVHTTTHTYSEQGDYAWTLIVTSGDDSASDSGVVSIGPSVELTSEPFPPLLDLKSGDTTVKFIANVEGGKPPYTYIWDLNGTPKETDQPFKRHTYSEVGKTVASVTIIDACEMSATDTLAVVVTDEEADACHPMAQKIADAVNTLVPLQADELYTCEEILDMVSGGLTGGQIGFGRLMHAFKLAEQLGELTWEEIRDWRLEGVGWGLIVQLDRYADVIEEIGLPELMEMVRSEEYSMNQLRTALRNTVRFGVDFFDVLARLEEGAKTGEINRFYRLAAELGVDPAALDAFLDSGVSLSDISRASKMAKSGDADWEELLTHFQVGHSWSDIRQAYRLESEAFSVAEILDIGIKEFRRLERSEARMERDEARDSRTALQIANKYGSSEDAVMAIYEGTCDYSWNCVRAHFRQLNQDKPSKRKNK
jgi:hypothetical protein